MKNKIAHRGISVKLTIMIMSWHTARFRKPVHPPVFSSHNSFRVEPTVHFSLDKKNYKRVYTSRQHTVLKSPGLKNLGSKDIFLTFGNGAEEKKDGSGVFSRRYYFRKVPAIKRAEYPLWIEGG